MKKIKNLLIPMIFVLCIFVLIFNARASEVKEIEFKEAIKLGLKKNNELNTIRNSIAELERNLEILDAGESFQVDLDITPIWIFSSNTENSDYTVKMNEDSLTPSLEVNMTATSQLTDDINFSTEISWESDNFYQESFSDLTNEINANLKLNKRIYPDSWSENKKQAYSLKNSLQIKIEELKWEETEKQIEFIGDYLNILRLQEQLNILEERTELAQEELERVNRKIELGEGGYQQESEARIALKEIENNLLNQQQALTRAKKKWYLSLNLPRDTVVAFKDNDNVDFIKSLYSQMESLELDDKNEDEFIKTVLEENYKINNSLLEKEELIKELEWTENEGKAKVNLSTGYQFPADWFIMLDFQINLLDGGVQILKEEQKESNIRQKEVSISYLNEQTKLEVGHLLDQDEYNILDLDMQKLSQEKEEDRIEIMEKQYKQGIISISNWENAKLTLREKEIKVKQARDEWFVNRLKLAHFIGYLQK
jgi:outer membrane protein TolC